jgi:uncharacterized membrane protein
MTIDGQSHDPATMPFAAPCRELSPAAPFRWLVSGVRDYRCALRASLAYGVSMALTIAAVSFAAWGYGAHWLMFAMLGGFVFLAPLACVGLYAISAQLERDQAPSLKRSLTAAFRRHLGNEMVFALALLVVFMVWARAATMVSVFFPADGDPSFSEMAGYLAIGSIVGAIFAAVTFSASAFSLPMIMHRDVDSITAIVTSINAVLRNKLPMAIWLALITLGLIAGAATAFVGLVFILPVIGYGAWHGYLETIDAGAFPRHALGITAVPRSSKR